MPSPPDAAPAPGDSAADGQSGLIFIVDDEAMIRDLARLALSRQGYDVETAASAPEALQRFEGFAERVEAVIVDKNLPGADGFELLAIFRERVPGLPALVISGEILTGTGDDVETPDGPTALVGKPFRLEELGRALGRVIAARGS